MTGDVKAELRRYIEDNFIMGASQQQFADDDSFLERQLLDSTGFLELVAHIEETYGVKVEDDEMVPENLDSIDNVSKYLARKRGG